VANHNIGFVVLMFFAGVGIPIMAALSSQLGARIESPWAAGFTLFVMGALVTGIVLAFNGGPPAKWFTAPPYLYLGGFLVAFYVLSVTWSAPKIGVGTAVFVVLVGQIFAAGAIDHFGLFGAAKTPLTLARVAGMALMLAGLFLARRVA
jgi:transporter family-2 protein